MMVVHHIFKIMCKAMCNPPLQNEYLHRNVAGSSLVSKNKNPDSMHVL
jgi:hypothetical protein